MMKRILVFISVTFLFSWLFFGVAYLQEASIIITPFNSELFLIFGRFAPSIVGILLLKDKVSIKKILRSTFLVKKDIKNLFMIFLLMPLLLGLSYLMIMLIESPDLITTLINQPIMMLIVYIYILFLGGPLGEEIGWRGFLLKGSLSKFKPISSGIIIGLIWTAWHIPLFFIPGNVQQNIPFGIYTIYTVLLSVIITILMVKTKRISSALYFHTSANFAIGVFYIFDSSYGFFIFGLIFAIVTAIIIIKNWKLLCTKTEIHLFEE